MNKIKTNYGSFILTVPSWVIPGTYAENLRFLEGKKEIKGVELLFFIYDDEIKTQLKNEWDEIFSYGERFVFTAHLPEPLRPVHEELVARLAPRVRHFIFHPEGNLGPDGPRRRVPDIKNPAAQARLLADWTNRYGAVFLAENTHLEYLEILLPYLEKDAGLCEDTGHLLLEGQNPAVFFETHRGRIKEIHLHGIKEEPAAEGLTSAMRASSPEKAADDGRLKDHRSLGGNEAWLCQLLLLLKDYRGVINLEMFSWEEIEPSIEAIAINQRPEGRQAG